MALSNEQFRVDLRIAFKNLKDDFKETSPPDPLYNCIAWSLGDSENWWWPHEDAMWLDEVPREETFQAFIAVYESRGYEICECGSLEYGYEKIAIFGKSGKPTHAARQMPCGNWTTKAGRAQDLTHFYLEGISCDAYGVPSVFMRRQTEDHC